MSEKPIIAHIKTRTGYETTHVFESMERALLDTYERSGSLDAIVKVDIMDESVE